MTLKIIEENIELTKIYSHLLDANEIESFREDKKVIEKRFTTPLQTNSNNTSLLVECENYFKDAIKVHDLNYKIKEFYGYLN